MNKPSVDELNKRVSELEFQLSQARLRERALTFAQLVVDRFPEPICCVGADARFVYFNEAACHMLGFTKAEMANLTLNEIAPDITPDMWPQYWAEIKKRGSFTSETHCRTKDGNVFPIEIIGSHLDFEGKEYQAVFVHDISKRRKAAETLSASEKKYRMLVDNSNNAIYTIDRDGSILFMNNKAARDFGSTPADFIGKTLYDLIPDMAEMLVERHSKIIDSGVGGVFEDEFQFRTGKVWLVSNIQPVKDARGRSEAVLTITSDITELKRAQEALWQSEERLALAVESTKDGIWDLDIVKNKAYVSPRCAELWAIESNTLVDDAFGIWISRIHEDYRYAVMHSILENLHGKATFDMEYLYLYENGESRWLRSLGMTFFDESGDAFRFVGSTRDISERKQAEDRLKQSEDAYRNLFDSIPDPVAIVQGDVHVLINQAFTNLLGYDQHDLEKGLGIFTPIKEDDDKKIVRRRIQRRLAGEEVIPKFQIMGLKGKDGQTVHCEVSATGIQYKGLPGVLVVFRDVTDRKGAEELIRRLTHQLIKSQEVERRMISRELHDRVAQDISSSRIECDVLAETDLIAPEAKQRVSDISDTLGSTLMAVRDFSYELRPPALEEQGLIRTLDAYCSNFSEKNPIHVECRFEGLDELKLSFDTMISLYRLVQEGLNNIWKHANASQATVGLEFSLPNIILRIEDNGSGFDAKRRPAEAINEKRMGLRNMEERVILLEGTMRIQSEPGRGTKIMISIPHREENLWPEDADGESIDG